MEIFFFVFTQLMQNVPTVRRIYVLCRSSLDDVDVNFFLFSFNLFYTFSLLILIALVITSQSQTIHSHSWINRDLSGGKSGACGKEGVGRCDGSVVR